MRERTIAENDMIRKKLRDRNYTLENLRAQEIMLADEIIET